MSYLGTMAFIGTIPTGALIGTLPGNNALQYLDTMLFIPWYNAIPMYNAMTWVGD